MNRRRAFALVASTALMGVSALAQDAPAIPSLGAAELNFSVENMDRSVSPKEDFYRYTSGAWLDQAVIPPSSPDVNVFSFMVDHVTEQMATVISDAAAKADDAEAGTPAQQVGDLYNSFMDLDRINAAGVTALQPALDTLEAVDSLDDLSTYLGKRGRDTASFVLAAIVPNADRADSTKMALWFLSGDLGIALGAIYEEGEDSARVVAYKTFVRDTLILAGDSPEIATETADLVFELEAKMHAGKATPVERVDPRNVYNPVPFEDLQAEIPELDLTLLARGLGLEPEETVVKTEPRYLGVLSQILRDYSLNEIKAYLRFRLIENYSSYLGPAFEAPGIALIQSLIGTSETKPREEMAQSLLKSNLGQPLSRLYIDAYFAEETRQTALDMMDRIKAAFLERIKTRSWLSEETRAAAIEKLERLTYYAGYPNEWLDYSSVEIKSDDLIGNIRRLNRHMIDVEVAKMGKTVVETHFSDDATLPLSVNAAYSPSMNGFDVPAAIIQPGMFDISQPAPVYFCRLGAVLGHEMTHGFDSGGRLFDADGNLRDWWTADDAAAFEAEAQKLVDQANAYEVLPGLMANGPLNVKENMADFGGITLAHAALMTYLEEHPEDNVETNGLTPSQLCFVAFSQMWATKSTDQYTAYLVGNDVHATGDYRAFAALQHVDAFYEAFDIKEGDPMWLAPEKRVHAW
ncbi:M13 family metallopeptidase [Devosia sp. 63-57]|uniref:M13 family metallopeptidase n=1 Tax=Devosia sp. 63-57 TaxID=1895751 RepID=UPI00086BEFFC|nr:M13 family metallopeptidase [Devosia sp. 63-57]ODT48584.1 MAG: peptidase M13 [Pelagibacterium sp. SCN 63-126]ODU80662.1 MAG: peptidase M13 [Pelagibacterium sp. SCN 63-17]OJX44037.1 MAG: peptidase M13 [Devosia sp. 63-57]